ARRPAGFTILLRSIAMVVAVGVIGFVVLSNVRPDSDPSSDPTPIPPSPPGSVTTSVVTTDALNVRAGASLDAAVIDTLSYGARLEVVGEARNGFTPIRHGAGQAWMASEFLTVDGSPGANAWRSREGVAPKSMATVVSEGPGQPNGTLEDVSVPYVSAEEAVLQERWIDVERTTG
ncbi:MAG: SH3 domain-containing protein, partial [Chloroflexota bacterium]|nr:SH3 domain-containing protein [Chloroflexota bacterium]